MSGFLFWVRCLFLGCFFHPLRLVYRQFWLCILSFGVFFSGCHSGHACFWDSLGTCGARVRSSSLGLPRPFFGREAARVFLCFSCLVFVFPLLFCLRPHVFRCPGRSSYRSGLWWSHQRLARVRARGSASSAGALDTPFSKLILHYFVCQRAPGTVGRAASGTFLEGRGNEQGTRCPSGFLLS